MNKNELNLYDYLALPNKDIRQQAKSDFFDTKQLFIDGERVKKNEEDKIYELDLLDNDDFFNNNILERIRIFNNSIMHITLTINKMYNYYLLLKAEINEGIRRYREEIYRWSARNLCIELCIYEEKIKNMLRYLYNLDDEKTMDNSILFSELNKIARTNPILKDLLISCDNFRKSKSYQEVDKIRNDEVHNKSLLDTYKYFKNLNEGRALVSPSYLIPTGFLYTITQEYLNGIVDVKNKLQIVIDNYETQ